MPFSISSDVRFFSLKLLISKKKLVVGWACLSVFIECYPINQLAHGILLINGFGGHAERFLLGAWLERQLQVCRITSAALIFCQIVFFLASNVALYICSSICQALR